MTLFFFHICDISFTYDVEFLHLPFLFFTHVAVVTFVTLFTFKVPTVGLLNFACSVIRPGMAFLRRLINLSIRVAELHHFVNKEVQLDISVWLEFLTSFNGKSFFLYEEKVTSESLQLYADAAASFGYGACFQTNKNTK